MFNTQDSGSTRVPTMQPPANVPEHTSPVGGYGPLTLVCTPDHADCYVICRTERGRRGWGVHAREGVLLVSGWPTKARAVAYANRLLPTGKNIRAGGAR